MPLPPDPPGPDDEGPPLGPVDDLDLPLLDERVDPATWIDTAGTGDDPQARLRQAIDQALEALRERLLSELAPLVGGGRRVRHAPDDQARERKG